MQDHSTNAEPSAANSEALRALRRALFEHPIAAQSAFAALVREGRRYAETPEGAAWKQRLAGSDLVARGRVVWEVLTQSAFTEDADTTLPSVLLDAFSRSTAVSMLEPFLSLIFEEGK
jgi:hypothetical protein